MISPTPIGKQSNNSPAPNTLDSAQVAIPQNAVSPTDCQRHHRRDPEDAAPPASSR